MVTNLDASIYPILKIPSAEGQKLEQLRFDRILCDVPCSGDGTLRKNIGIWKSWQPMDGNGLHALVTWLFSVSSEINVPCSLQLRILQRAMKLLKSDGRIVYSTCSLNPVENEAVIAEALKANTGRCTLYYFLRKWWILVISIRFLLGWCFFQTPGTEAKTGTDNMAPQRWSWNHDIVRNLQRLLEFSSWTRQYQADRRSLATERVGIS